MQPTSEDTRRADSNGSSRRIVLDWVTDEPERRWRVVEGTMVFADISGFTALSEKLATRGRIGTEELIEP